MKICFLCPGLEPGKDAVGDYTIEVGSRLVVLGWDVCVVALVDRNVQQLEHSERSGCRTIRYPRGYSEDERWRRLADTFGEFGPDWVSLQWVAFGYQDKGLPVGFGKALRRVAGKLPIHVMCHEIWVRADGAGSLKERVYSRLQRLVHQQCFRALRPAVTHTHAEPYRRALETAGFSAGLLPLGSNIHPVPLDADLASEGEQSPVDTACQLAFIVFGNTPPEWDAPAVIRKLGAGCQGLGKEALLWFSGKGGPRGDEGESLVRLGCEVGVRVEFLGFLETGEILHYMRHAHAGLATVPFALWQKSSAVAAMRTAGLPVLFSRFDGVWDKAWLPHWETGFYRLEEDAIASVVNDGRQPQIDLWDDAVRRFMADLK